MLKFIWKSKSKCDRSITETNSANKRDLVRFARSPQGHVFSCSEKNTNCRFFSAPSSRSIFLLDLFSTPSHKGPFFLKHSKCLVLPVVYVPGCSCECLTRMAWICFSLHFIPDTVFFLVLVWNFSVCILFYQIHHQFYRCIFLVWNIAP